MAGSASDTTIHRNEPPMSKTAKNNIQIFLSDTAGSFADVHFVLRNVEALICGSVWSEIMRGPNIAHDGIAEHDKQTFEEIGAASGFHKGNIYDLRQLEAKILASLQGSAFPFRDAPRGTWTPFDWRNSYREADLTARCVFMSEALRERDFALYQRLFAPFQITKVDRHSPVVVEIAIALGSAVGATGLLTLSALKLVAADLRGRIRQQEEELNLELQQLRTRLAALLVKEIENQREDITVSPEVLQAAATLMAQPVKNLTRSPLVDKITLGLSTGF